MSLYDTLYVYSIHYIIYISYKPTTLTLYNKISSTVIIKHTYGMESDLNYFVERTPIARSLDNQRRTRQDKTKTN